MRTDPINNDPVLPGIVTPMRSVSPGIAKPNYAETGRPGPNIRQKPKSQEVIESMRRAGVLAREVLDATAAKVDVGVTTESLDAFAHEMIQSRDAYPSPLNYQGYPKSICTSVNEVICHGIPDSRVLQDGDIINVDITVFLDGVHGDCSATYCVGNVDAESQGLMRVTGECLVRGIGAVKPGRPVSDIGQAIERHAVAHGLGVVKAFTGHGIGETFHMSPQVLHYYEPTAREEMLEGMTFTIEPMITLGTYRHVMWDDGWTAVTADARRSAQYEHTVLVTRGGAEVLTGDPY